MARLTLDISTSLDGFVAGPNQTLEQPLGEGGERLHEWAFAVAGFREMHGLPGGETNVDNEVVEETLGNTGATVMGRRMFSGGVNDLAGAAGLSRAHFSREFRSACLIAKGFAGTIFLTTDDCHAAYEELKGRDVEFVEQP